MFAAVVAPAKLVDDDAFGLRLVVRIGVQDANGLNPLDVRIAQIAAEHAHGGIRAQWARAERAMHGTQMGEIRVAVTPGRGQAHLRCKVAACEDGLDPLLRRYAPQSR